MKTGFQYALLLGLMLPCWAISLYLAYRVGRIAGRIGW